MKTLIQQTADQINSFKFFYEMSEMDSTFRQYSAIEKNVAQALEQMTPDQIEEVKSLLTVSMERVNRYWGKYFPETSPEATGEAIEENGNPETIETEKTPQSAKSVIMTRAHEIRKRTGESMSIALCRSWAAYRLGQTMRSGTTLFYYKKKDGSLRRASGTLKVDRAQQTSSKPNPKVMTYFDLDKNGWRSFRIENLIRVV